MFSRPRQLDSEPALYEAAIKILMRRAHSVHEMKQALARRCEDASLIKKVLDRLKQEKLLDDARYAKQFARHRSESRKQGKYRIARDLRARGVPDRHIDAALEESSTDAGDSALIRQRIERKLKLLRGEIDDRKLASLYRSLLRSGFSSDLIRRELRRLTHEDVPEIEEPSDSSS
jgi:regulatory protein